LTDDARGAFEEGVEIESTDQLVRVLIIEDHALLASEIARLMTGESDFEVVSVTGTGADGLNATIQYKPQVILMDYRLPDIAGPAAAGMILAAYPAAAIVFFSGVEAEGALLDAVDAGATAYLTMHATGDQLVEAVRRAARGDSLIPIELFVRAMARQRNNVAAERERDKVAADFTPRELEVLRLLAIGLGTNDMSDRLGIAPHTVEWHIRHLIEKLHVHSKLQAVIAAARLGLIELTGPQ
jgi:two-component system nitrate/nitrite response regulator NarL